MGAMPCGMPLRRVVIFYSKTKEKHTRGERSFEGVTYSGSLKEIASAEFDAVVSEAGREWVIMSGLERSIFNKISRHKALKDWDIKINYGIKTGYNEAFIIDEETKDMLIKEDKKSAEIIKPLLRGRDIKRYSYVNNGLYLLFIPWHFPLHKDDSITGASEKAEKEFKKQYKAIYNHLLEHKDKLSNRNKSETGIRYEWYALQRCAASYYEEFDKPKLIYAEIVRGASFSYDDTGIYPEATTFLMTGKDIKYLLGVLNSRFGEYAFKKFFAGGGLGNDGFRYKKDFLEKLCIPEADSKTKNNITKIVDQIITLKKQDKDTTPLEKNIDEIVYSLYGLSDEEVKVVEG